MTRARTKARALVVVPQRRQEAVEAVGRIGELARAKAANQAVADEKRRLAGEELERANAQLDAELAEVVAGVQAYCEAHRTELTGNGRVKFHEFGTGTVRWKHRPPKVMIRAKEVVIESCRSLGLTQFLRVTTDLNKEAMLANPERATSIQGVHIGSEGEDFVIEPAEVEVGA